MSENTFMVLRLSNDPGKFIVTPWPSPVPPSDPSFGLVPPEQVFRGTEEQVREFLAEKGQASSQIQTLIERANRSPATNAPEYIVTRSLRFS